MVVMILIFVVMEQVEVVVFILMVMMNQNGVINMVLVS